MELKINNIIRNSLYCASKYAHKTNEKYSSIWLKSNRYELYIHSTDGYILYSARHDIRIKPLDLYFMIRNVQTDILKHVDSINIGSSNATFMRNGEPVLSTEVVHNPQNRFDFDGLFRDPGFASFYTKKSSIKDALKEYKHLLEKRNNSVLLKMHISSDGVKLTSSDGVTVKLNATDITGKYIVEFDALKLRRILEVLYNDVYIELAKPVYNTIIRIMSEEVWCALATGTTD